MREIHGWFIWCGIGTVDEKHEEITGLTKAEAIEQAVQKAAEWPRVLICQKCAKYPHGVELGGIEYGRMSGKIFENAYNAGNPAVVKYVEIKCGGAYRG